MAALVEYYAGFTQKKELQFWEKIMLYCTVSLRA